MQTQFFALIHKLRKDKIFRIIDEKEFYFSDEQLKLLIKYILEFNKIKILPKKNLSFDQKKKLSGCHGIALDSSLILKFGQKILRLGVIYDILTEKCTLFYQTEEMLHSYTLIKIKPRDKKILCGNLFIYSKSIKKNYTDLQNILYRAFNYLLPIYDYILKNYKLIYRCSNFIKSNISLYDKNRLKCLNRDIRKLIY